MARLGEAILRNRTIVRAPIWLYRAGLGFVFGSRLLLLEHIGRRSGARRFVVLEVVDRSERGYVVASGFGVRAQWYRNVRQQPRARIRIGRSGWQSVTARPIERDEAVEILQRYAERHPRAWQQLRPIFEQTLDARIDDDETSLPLVALELSPER